MALQAYIDESADDQNGNFVMAAYLSTAEKWSEFSHEWRRLLPLTPTQADGRHRFKMSEMARLGRMANVREFHRVINKYAESSFAIILNRHRLINVLAGVSVSIPIGDGRFGDLNLDRLREEWRDPYVSVFYAFINSILNVLLQQPELVHGDGPVEFFFDEITQQKRMIGDWPAYLRDADPAKTSLLAGEPVFASDDALLPLQAADFRAWWLIQRAKRLPDLDLLEGTYPWRVDDIDTVSASMFAFSDDDLREMIRGRIYNNLIREGVDVKVGSEAFHLDLGEGGALPVIEFRG